YTGPVRAGAIPNGKGTCVKAGKTSPCEYREGKAVEGAVVVPPPKPEPKPEARPVAKPEPKVAAPVAVAPKPEELKPADPPKPKDPRTQRGVRANGSQF